MCHIYIGCSMWRDESVLWRGNRMCKPSGLARLIRAQRHCQGERRGSFIGRQKELPGRSKSFRVTQDKGTAP